MTGTYTPWGLKKQNNHQAHHHHHRGQKIDHTKRQLLTHKASPPPEPPQPCAEFLHGSEGLVGPPLPRLHTEEIPAVEHMLYSQRHPYISTAKEKQI